MELYSSENIQLYPELYSGRNIEQWSIQLWEHTAVVLYAYSESDPDYSELL